MLSKSFRFILDPYEWNYPGRTKEDFSVGWWSVYSIGLVLTVKRKRRQMSVP